MDIRELESFDLKSAIKFNDRLNPRIFDSRERMLPEVRERLLAIADDFRQFLGVTGYELKDITISGSNAAYTYTPHSDIDLHLVADIPEADSSEVFRELFDAKKYQYNDQHDIKIGGYDVELYVQNANQPHHSQGIYSVLEDKWLSIPRRKKPTVDDISVRSKYEDVGERVEQAIESGDLDRMNAVATKIKTMRQTGLETTGEFGPENLAFKVLRSNGTLDRLRTARLAAQDRLMSLDERKKSRRRRRPRSSIYGVGWFPGFGYYGGETDGGSGGGDGGGGESAQEDYDPNAQPPGPEFKPEMPAGTVLVNVSDVYDWYKLGQDISDLPHANRQAYGKGAPQTVLSFGSEPLEHEYKQDLDRLGLKTLDIDRRAKRKDPEAAYRMDEADHTRSMLDQFVEFTAQHLGIEHLPRVRYKRDPAWSQRNNTFGRYVPEEHTLYVSLANRHPLDIMRTIAHELVHHRQGEKDPDLERDGSTGSPQENEANAQAGIIMRQFADLNPDYFQDRPIEEQSTDTAEPVVRDQVVYDIPYTAIARPERLRDIRRFGKIYHYRTAGTPVAMISVPRDREEAFQSAMRSQGVPVTPTRMLEASGYIPTKREQNDPRFKMALTHDVRPGETGRQANKLSLKTNSQGQPQLLMRHLRNLLESIKSQEEDLFEVKMSPGELRRWAESPEAEGIRAGFEAEMIFRDTSGGESEDYEPDYDQDERARDIDEVLDFFRGGEGGISGGMANRLRESLYEEYIEWRETQIYNQFEEVADEQVRDYMETNIWGDDDQRDQYRERAREELGIQTSEQSAERAEEIEARAREFFDEDVEQSIEEQDDNYANAREYFRDMMADGDDFDQSDWFRNNYSHMSDVADAFGLDWPYYTGGREGTGSRSVEDIAGSLQYAIDMPVVGSSNYHGTTRRPGRWIIEPDGSLDPDEPDDELGLEIVSPPMPLPETLRKLQQVLDWANGDGDAYTNSSTGLHMGMSIPFKGGNVDYVKLILFMGDQYVLDKFDRMANTYCASALDKLRQTQTARRRGVRENVRGWDDEPAGKMTGAEKTAAAMDLMRKNLIELAQGLVQDGVGLSKYTSAHIKDGYIEFRSPGGDYLSLNDREDQALEDTMLRFARAMYIAGRPDVERKEYSKKLYKLLSGFKGAETAKTGKDTRYRTSIETEGANDALELFARYSSGMINQEELKKQWAEQVLAKEAPPQRSLEDGKEYEVVRQDTGEVIDIIRDWTLASANETALVKYSGKGFDFFVRVKDTEPEKKLSRRAQVAKRIKERPSIWRVTDTNTGRSITVAADGTQDAKYQARQQDPDFQRLFYNDPDSMLVEPASAEEIRQYMSQQKDQEKDTQQVQQRVQGRSGRYRVRWTERRGEREAQDSLTVDAANADAAMTAIRHALQAQGRDVISIQADLAGSTQDLQQQRAQQSGGEFTGRWNIQDALSGEVLHTISGIGNNQGDANRHAREWIDRTGYSGAYEIVPEMR